MNKSCPECCAIIPKDANVCPACTQRIVGNSCPDCLALSPEGANVCRHCQHKFKAQTQQLNFRAFQIRADPIATLLLRWSFFPQKAVFNSDKIVITSYGFFGLTSHNEEIPWEKVAGFTHRSGILWDYVSIETRGQSSATISCLDKKSSAKVCDILQRLER